MTNQDWVSRLGIYSRAMWEWNNSLEPVWYVAVGDQIAQAVNEAMNSPWEWEIEEPEDLHSRQVQAELHHCLTKYPESNQISNLERELLEADSFWARPSMEQLKTIAKDLKAQSHPLDHWIPTAFLPVELAVIKNHLGLSDPYLLT